MSGVIFCERRPAWRLTAVAAWIVIVLSDSCAPAPPHPPPPVTTAPAKQPVIIAHALGTVRGIRGSNSREAFEHNYARGARIFEVDVAFTRDGDLVCFHWDQESRLGLGTKITDTPTAGFLGRRFRDAFSVWTFEDLLRRAARLPDVYIVTDTKYWDASFFSNVVRTIGSVDPALFRRIIPQIYKPSDMEFFTGRPFPTMIFTLYQIDITDDEVVEFVNKADIPIVTMSTGRFNKTLVSRLAGRRVYVHTVNDPSVVRDLSAVGADGFYVDDVDSIGIEK